jgi:hypothetical protein
MSSIYKAMPVDLDFNGKPIGYEALTPRMEATVVGLPLESEDSNFRVPQTNYTTLDLE